MRIAGDAYVILHGIGGIVHMKSIELSETFILVVLSHVYISGRFRNPVIEIRPRTSS